MDTRTGQIYPSLDAALDAGVPSNRLATVEVKGEIVTIMSGPFKGRRYQRMSDGTLGRRIKEAARVD
jgi:hypothetical protein